MSAIKDMILVSLIGARPSARCVSDVTVLEMWTMSSFVLNAIGISSDKAASLITKTMSECRLSARLFLDASIVPVRCHRGDAIPIIHISVVNHSASYAISTACRDITNAISRRKCSTARTRRVTGMRNFFILILKLLLTPI